MTPYNFHYSYNSWRYRLWERLWLPLMARRYRQRLARWHALGKPLRVALVKQDCNEDLYCCAPGLAPLETLRSTLLRSGPAALFKLFDTTFYIVRTEPDPECNIWKEKAEILGWCPLTWFEDFRNRVPGRDHGQSLFARDVNEVPWDSFDLVISMDIAVPERLTRRFPQVVWAYYVRELKMPSFHRSMEQALPGQDLFLSQDFSPLFKKDGQHVVRFPYHFHYYGIFHELTERVIPSIVTGSQRQGIFLDHHTATELTANDWESLAQFGPVYSTFRDVDNFDQVAQKAVPSRTMEPKILEKLMKSKYYIKIGGRNVYGTAMVEAIAAGCLALADPARTANNFFYSPPLCATNIPDVIDKLCQLEASESLYIQQVKRQRLLMDYLCFYRPAIQLIAERARVSKSRIGGHNDIK